MTLLFIERYPFGKRFTVSFIDDTDCAILSEIEPVYEFLVSNNFRTTKTVWPLKATSISGNSPETRINGDTLESREYRNFCLELRSFEFEIAMHTASAGNSKREETIKAYEFFGDIFGYPPETNIMHGRNVDNIYWGKYCVSNPIMSKLISLIEPQEFLGHNIDHEYYWGDICREKTKYVRLFETIGSDLDW